MVAVRTSCTVADDHCKCFDALTEEQLALLEKKQVTVQYNKGEIIAKHGAFASHVVFLCEGLVKVYMEHGNQTLILKIISPGNLVGLSSLSEGENTFQYSAAAYQKSVAKLIDITTFKHLIRENGHFASKVISILGENSNQINNRFFCLTNRQSYGRLADLLLCLAGRVFKSDKFELDLTRKELAELAGMSTENVIRILKKFQDDGLIELKGKNIDLKDMEALQRICDLG
ncbi:MAG: Crp/Fnr family transcriptional regulator [Bacteroidales bacterium]|jgi:CRP/FNR family transcriptional regulator|nr:Crp/Fnr family transcriptional regulator [Bacteroidales bacterium]